MPDEKIQAAPVEIKSIPLAVTQVKPGWKTTEFWLTVATGAGTLFGDFIPASWKAAVVTVTAAAYAISRAIAKK